MAITLTLDRTLPVSLAEQIRRGIASAIQSGVLKPGARLPSWIDLAAQLGVARGTVQAAYEMLADAQLVVASPATGTCVTERPNRAPREETAKPMGFMGLYQALIAGPAIFQLGIPAQESLPVKLFSRVRTHAMRLTLGGSNCYPDPLGEAELRQEIAAYLGLARGLECSPSQIIITNGFASGLGLVLRALNAEGKQAWIEEPCFPVTRRALELANLIPVPVAVDEGGLDVETGKQLAANAALAVVTPGQQAPLGMPLSLARRLSLLEWAKEADAWIIEDDYLSELQLEGRAVPALASLDQHGRVIHIGSFSKTISPTLRLGFVVAPSRLSSRLAEIAACLQPAPNPAVQLAMAEFMQAGHYLRHLRRTKRLYRRQRGELLQALSAHGLAKDISVAGLAVLLKLPKGSPDRQIAQAATAHGIAPGALSAWYSNPKIAQHGMLLGIATSATADVQTSCRKLQEVIERVLEPAETP